MKKPISIFVILFLSLYTKAQLQKDNTMLGLAAYYSNQTTDNAALPGINNSNMVSGNYKSNSIQAAANYGYFLKKNLALGLTVIYSNNSYISLRSDPNTPSPYDSKSTGENYSAGFFGRFYKPVLENRIAFFCHARVIYGWGTNTTNYSTNYLNSSTFPASSKSEFKGFGINLNPGVTYFLNKRIGMEVAFGNLGFVQQYSTNYVSGTKAGTSNSSIVNFNFSYSSVTLGIVFYLGEMAYKSDSEKK